MHDHTLQLVRIKGECVSLFTEKNYLDPLIVSAKGSMDRRESKRHRDNLAVSLLSQEKNENLKFLVPAAYMKHDTD